MDISAIISAAGLAELVGLVMSAVGSLTTVVVDISRFELLWNYKEDIQKADTIQKARQQIFHIDNKIAEGDEGFEILEKVIVEKSGTDIRPEKIVTEDPGSYGGGGVMFVIEGEDGSEIQTHIGSHNLVDGWIQQEIDRLERQVKDKYRQYGMLLLFLGFVIQLISFFISMC